MAAVIQLRNGSLKSPVLALWVADRTCVNSSRTRRRRPDEWLRSGSLGPSKLATDRGEAGASTGKNVPVRRRTKPRLGRALGTGAHHRSAGASPLDEEDVVGMLLAAEHGVDSTRISAYKALGRILDLEQMLRAAFRGELRDVVLLPESQRRELA